MSEQHNSSNIYERFAQVTKQMKDLVDNMEQLQVQITEILEKNVELSIENEHLRQVIKQNQPRHSDDQLSGSRQNLKELYQQGFHVCSEYYGKRLAPNESCTFCLDAIFGHEQGVTK
ncbi:DNA replication initiation control protein YabA [Limosilactobacillus caccae]|jgi:regulator of replication initiation timing|uniref:DNA replication initiation control protein YabA n=1 Tax=Limosilactobacillus caccae TaxID=1926284 RepID=UPI00097136D1|nr:DNA replication initiation control protein YabA [Limosilactobacillus caccae]